MLTKFQKLSAPAFIEQLILELRRGQSLVPFVGAGFSAPSGVLMGQDFSEYLAYTVLLCVCDDDRLLKSVGQENGRWNLREHGWPAYPDSTQVDQAKNWVRDKFLEIVDRRRKAAPVSRAMSGNFPEDIAWALTSPLTPQTVSDQPDQTHLRRLFRLLNARLLLHGGYNVSGYSPTSQDAVEERAVRSLHDWRATLNFLSELMLTSDGRLLLTEQDTAIVDSFNVHITRDRKPNLGHNMLCHLSGPARFRTILTTNFDTLIEDAFQELNERIEAISVSSKGDLPAPELVHSKNMVVKMHGTLWETRADFSLDDSPSPQSLRSFFHYIRGRYPDQAPSGKGLLPAHLLVCGYSGSDNRCMEMIKFMLDADAEAKVFWVCHTEEQVRSLQQQIFCEPSYRKPVSKRTECRILAAATQRTDLLLYELYQHLCLSLPKGGFSYQYTANVPPHVQDKRRLVPGGDERVGNNKTESDRIVDWFTGEHQLSRPKETRRFPGSDRLATIDGTQGVLSTLRKSVENIVEKRKGTVVWLELEDYPDVFCLAYELILIISIRLGLFQLGHADIVPAELIKRTEEGSDASVEPWFNHIQSLVRDYLEINPSKWLIVLYGRNGAGGCSGWEDGQYWQDTEYARLHMLNKALVKLGFRVIYAPHTALRAERDAKKPSILQKILRRHLRHDTIWQLPENPDGEWDVPVDPSGTHFPADFHPDDEPATSELSNLPVSFENTMAYLAKEWTACANVWPNEDARDQSELVFQRLRFLYASSLFRQSRHYSAFLNDGILPCPAQFNCQAIDNDWKRSETVAKYRNRLIESCIFNEKPGGFAWVYRDIRIGIRQMIDHLPDTWYKALDLKLEGPSHSSVNPSNSKTSSYSLEPFYTWRSHHHYWIAEWYLRAFYTTGHGTPLLEALSHLYKTILHLKSFRKGARFTSLKPDATPIDQEKERIGRCYLLWRRATCDMIKTLRAGSHAIRFWLGPAQFRAWFSEDHCKRISRAFDPHGGGLETPVSLLFQDLRLGKLGSEILAHAENLHQLLALELERLIPHGSERNRVKDYRVHCLEICDKYTVAQAPIESSDSSDTFWKPQTEGTVVGELLSLVFAEESQTDSIDTKALQRDVKRVRRNFPREHPSDAELFNSIQQMNEWAFELLRRGKLHQRLGYLRTKRMIKLDSTTKRLWLAVSVLCNTSLDFCRLLHPGLETFELKERVKALCLYSVSLARLNRFYEAHRRLNEAHALLSKHENPESRVLLGILQLRRAEAYLMENIFLRWFSTANDEDLNESGFDIGHLNHRYFRNDLHHAMSSRDSSDVSAEKREQLKVVSLAKLDDAWCALESAERLLAGQTHSPRWWARLCSLKLQCLYIFWDTKNKDLSCHCTLARRIPSHPFRQILTLLKKGTASCHGKIALQLRILDFARHAAAAYIESARFDQEFNVEETVKSSVLEDFQKITTNTLEHARRSLASPREKSGKKFQHPVAVYLDELVLILDRPLTG